MSTSEHQEKVKVMRLMQKSLDKLETASTCSERRSDACMSLPQDWLRHAHDRLMKYDEKNDELAYETNMMSMSGTRVKMRPALMMWTRCDMHEYAISAMRRAQQTHERNPFESYMCLMRMLGLSLG